MSFRLGLLVIVVLTVVLTLAIFLRSAAGSRPSQGPNISLTCVGIRKVAHSATTAPEPATFFSLSNATPHRWLCRTKGIEYSTPAGQVTNRTWGFQAKALTFNSTGGPSLVEPDEEYVLGAGQVREFYVPGMVTNHSLVVHLECQGKARGVLGRINDFQDQRDARARAPTGVTSETFWGGRRYPTVLLEGNQ
jgi:hypothetical protein